ncbi:hypothetical protein EJB05_57581, partial [Eragrostis curvula]
MSRRLFHMDLKPGNILLDENMVPKLADFSLARLFGEEQSRTCTWSCDGTLGYMSPEYINKGIITKKSDIFSLGVIMIEIITGNKDYPDIGEEQKYIDFIALLCVVLDRVKRPTTRQIIKMLQSESADFNNGSMLSPPTYQAQYSSQLYLTQELQHLANTSEGPQAYTNLERDHQPKRRCLEIDPSCMEANRIPSAGKSAVSLLKANGYDNPECLLQDQSSEPRSLSLPYLRNITNNFSVERLVGKGGFGEVYKGVLPNGDEIAVKKLKLSGVGLHDIQFQDEACILMRLEHPNIVKFLGYCYETENIPILLEGKYVVAEKTEMLICLEFLPEGSLCEHLSDESSGLDWDVRYKIIQGICCGLHYLHEEWQLNNPIIHMDLKPANKLLDQNMVPKIADFGVSRLFGHENSQIRTSNCKGTLKFDIFILGVIIMEILTGGREYPDGTTTDSVPSHVYADNVLQKWRARFEKTQGYASVEVSCQQIARCLNIGLVCVKRDRTKRPTTSQIMEMLHGSESTDCSFKKEMDEPDEQTPAHEGEAHAEAKG